MALVCLILSFRAKSKGMDERWISMREVWSVYASAWLLMTAYPHKNLHTFLKCIIYDQLTSLSFSHISAKKKKFTILWESTNLNNARFHYRSHPHKPVPVSTLWETHQTDVLDFCKSACFNAFHRSTQQWMPQLHRNVAQTQMRDFLYQHCLNGETVNTAPAHFKSPHGQIKFSSDARHRPLGDSVPCRTSCR